MYLWATLIAGMCAILALANADTPANCTYEDVAGQWMLYEGKRDMTSGLDCSAVTINDLTHVTVVRLMFPNIVVDQDGAIGTWTLIYNQGFEIKLRDRKYFAFSKYFQSGSKVTSYCYETSPGWSHDIYSRDWSCFLAKKTGGGGGGVVGAKEHENPMSLPTSKAQSTQLYRNNEPFIYTINTVQSSWKAASYPEHEQLTLRDVVRRMGGIKSRVSTPPGPKPATLEEIKAAQDLPLSFDWRNVNGRNFVSPVRNQGSCGSCYSFGSMGLLEARYRIRTNGTDTPVFSTQDVVECSEYSQGCEGGFPYLIAGKYAEDFGVVLEECNPYPSVQPTNPTCQTKQSCRKYYATRYRYVGGYYGGSNEPLMRAAIVHNGPIAVSFMVYPDFMNYKSGVYRHTGLRDTINGINEFEDGFNPFHITNHVVLVVGYGQDDKGTPYWIVKNSWGAAWGENGYFKIARGNDECSIESMTVETDPIPTY